VARPRKCKNTNEIAGFRALAHNAPDGGRTIKVTTDKLGSRQKTAVRRQERGRVEKTHRGQCG